MPSTRPSCCRLHLSGRLYKLKGNETIPNLNLKRLKRYLHPNIWILTLGPRLLLKGFLYQGKGEYLDDHGIDIVFHVVS